ncbi:hypothetical protein [Enterobacter genomosp. S]|uniref:hypothetical protein n=1 Tax=Enterobacter genomosp. S TaxID=2364151 RepID=UPI003D7ABD6F
MTNAARPVIRCRFGLFIVHNYFSGNPEAGWSVLFLYSLTQQYDQLVIATQIKFLHHYTFMGKDRFLAHLQHVSGLHNRRPSVEIDKGYSLFLVLSLA